MKAVLTVIGKDNVGIIAGVSKELAALTINILDVSQTIMEGNFTMMMMCDLSETTAEFDQVKETLKETGDKLKVKISIQREELFSTMHSL
ncbi:ACT domain-containing protein [Carnobacterium maltaromaticum]|uniref:ACT domain-containing protein n=1 Tax=Carnobacterium maltaromaticum TaxID=2751 RepID=UPI000C79372E|nr:ACT domain-containing protein [Carnobacterium maltaromaticum]PLS34066.1 ACT domain-containing protein [Carnobacterium maltaromaticum]PLS34201.1 ACT domain-containing protein [Carnobacterium maltaromaticum]PLS34337.1 ACT domain-containing protein [Carnobacterium maltaromaticum]PLS41665.1 ACT domain-containing protein [Carnobacterium maltaromaticum]PLS43147.1 ACT domain-containing protein [Carnobacterium maltaromaticum]